MARKRTSADSSTKRGLLARPLEALAFLLPLIVFYEVVSLTRSQDRVIAYHLLRRFFELFGNTGMWAPGLGVVAILLATHVASGEKWAIRLDRVAAMYLEAAVMALPLVVLNWTVQLTGAAHGGGALIDDIAMGIGAGVYEELVFRLILISIVVMIGMDLLRLNPTWVTAVAVALSSLAFAVHHYHPVGVETFDLTSSVFRATFAFRTVAGAYLAIIFWYRGYGPAAGCHAAYNVAVVGLDAWLG